MPATSNETENSLDTSTIARNGKDGDKAIATPKGIASEGSHMDNKDDAMGERLRGGKRTRRELSPGSSYSPDAKHISATTPDRNEGKVLEYSPEKTTKNKPRVPEDMQAGKTENSSFQRIQSLFTISPDRATKVKNAVQNIFGPATSSLASALLPAKEVTGHQQGIPLYIDTLHLGILPQVYNQYMN